MKNVVKCPHCGKEVKITDAWMHEMEELVRSEENTKFQKELEVAKSEAEKKVREKISKDLQDKEDEILQLKKRAEEAEQEERKIRQEKRELETAKQKFEIEKERQLDEERNKIRQEAVKNVEEEHKFKELENQKIINDLKNALEDMKRKAQLGSQQLQGEVLELDLEETLRTSFPTDDITPVGKGVQGADVIQTVKNQTGKTAGIILWETKRAKWTPSWLPKLRENGRKSDATIVVLVSEQLPKDVDSFRVVEGVLVTSIPYSLPLAGILRRSVMQLAQAKNAAANKDETLESVYQYLQSDTFKNRFEAFAEGIIQLQGDLNSERRAMERVWKQREVHINNTLVNSSRMYGELQAVMGNALPDIKSFSLPVGDDTKDQKD